MFFQYPIKVKFLNIQGSQKWFQITFLNLILYGPHVPLWIVTETILSGDALRKIRSESNTVLEWFLSNNQKMCGFRKSIKVTVIYVEYEKIATWDWEQGGTRRKRTLRIVWLTDNPTMFVFLWLIDQWCLEVILSPWEVTTDEVYFIHKPKKWTLFSLWYTNYCTFRYLDPV